jgi:branched-chain amino acid aminotransferase
MSEFVCINGDYIKNDKPLIYVSNRCFRYGDGIFETMHFSEGKIQFLSDHYRRLIKSAKIIKIEVPLWFTQDFILEKVNRLVNANKFFKGVRIRLSLFRAGTGKYTPETNAMNYLIETEPLNNIYYTLNEKGLMIDIYSEIKKTINPLSSIKSSNALLYIMAGIYKKENNYDDCIILNEKNNICEATSSNIFIIKSNKIFTPSLKEGCIDGIMRKQIIEIANDNGLEVFDSAPITIDNLLFADEIFLTNAINGIRWVVGFQHKRYFNKTSVFLTEKLNKIAFNLK